MVTPKTAGSSFAALILIGLLWGLNWPAVKFMLTEIPPLTIRAVAFPLAAITLAIITRVMGHSLRVPVQERRAVVITGLLLIFGFNALTSLGQMLVETSKAAIIAYTMPAMTAILAAGFLGERMSARVMLALVLGMGGLAVLASEDIAALRADPVGPMIMVCAALSWACGNVALKARVWSVSPLALAVWFFAVSSIAVWPLVLIFEPPWQQSMPSTPVIWTLGYHVMGPMIVCYVLWTVLMEKLPATVAAISTLTAPVTGVVSSMILLGDPPSWQKLVALAMIVVSIAVTIFKMPKMRERP